MKIKLISRIILPLLAACIAMFAVGCSDDDPITPTSGINPEVVNTQDSFELQVTEVDNETAFWTFYWITTATVANIDQSCFLENGHATLIIYDADNKRVYARDMTQDGTYQTDSATPGRWRIDVSISRATGTLNFRAEKEL